MKNRIGSPLPGGRHLTHRILEGLLGALVMLQAEGNAAFQTPRKATERRADLRAVGIVVDEQTSSIIDVGAVLRAAVAAWEEVP